MGVLGLDTFVRTNQSGWGSGSDTQAWAEVFGTGVLSIVSNKGRITGNTNLTHVFYGSTTSVDQEVVARFTPSANTSTWGIILRATSANVCYRVRCNGAQFNASYDNSGTNVILTNTLTFAVRGGTTYWIHGRINGSTIYGKIWIDGTAEPSAWSIINTDTNITTAGQYGIALKNGSVSDTIDVDKFYATDTVFNDVPLVVSDSTLNTLVQNVSDVLSNTEVSLNIQTTVPIDTFTCTEVASLSLAFSALDTLISTEVTSNTLFYLVSEHLTVLASDQLALVNMALTFKASDTLVSSDNISKSYLYTFSDTCTLTESVFLTEAYIDLTTLILNDSIASVIGGNLFALDIFQRVNNSGGWGTTSDAGGTWVGSSGGATPALLSNQATLTGSTVLTTVTLATGSADTELFMHFSSSSASDQIAGMLHTGVPLAYYFAGVDGAGNFVVGMFSGGVSTVLATTTFSYSASTGYFLRFRLQGSLLQAKLWQDAAVEPVSFALSITDGTLGMGGVGVQATLSSTTDTAFVDYFSATSLTFPFTESVVLNDVSTVTQSVIATDSTSLTEPFMAPLYFNMYSPDLTIYALDTFNRANIDGWWGIPSDIGTGWYIANPGNSDVEIESAMGTITRGTSNFVLFPTHVGFADGEVLVYVVVDSTTSKVGATIRYRGAGDYYDIAYHNSLINFNLVSPPNGFITQLSSTPVVGLVNTGYWLRVRAQGFNFSIKWWDATTTEPVGWTIDNIVETSNPGPGLAGVLAQPGLSGTGICSFSNFSSGPVNFSIQSAYQDQVAVGYNDQSDVPS